jgi:TRAP-type mannitol/chloroaromatic compound transport system substrate-binding protein
MGKYSEVTDETREIFKNILAERDLERILTVDIVGENKLKNDEGYKVGKANPYASHKTGVDVVIYLNEDVFDRLDEAQQRILADEAITGISVNLESGALKIEGFDYKTHKGIIEKYNQEIVLSLKESIKSVYDQIKEEQAEQAG